MSKVLSTKQLYRLDEGTLLELVAQYRIPLLYFVTGFTRNTADAEDIVSETLVKLLTKKPVLKSEQALKTYLYKTARNIAVDKLRKQKRERAYIAQTTAQAERELAYIEETLSETEDKRALASALRLLSPDYRQVLYFYYFEDLTITELCKVLGKNKKQIYNLLARAKDALANILKKEEEKNEI